MKNSNTSDRKHRTSDRTIATLWTAVVLFLLLLLGLELRRGNLIETNILELLPASEKDPVIEKALNSFTSAVSRRMIFLVGSPEEEKAGEAAKLFAASLAKDGVFETVSCLHDAAEKSFQQLYFPYRFQLLSPKIRKLLAEPEGGEHFLKETAELLYSPFSSLYTRTLGEDPLLLYPRFLLQAPGPPGKIRFEHGVLLVESSGMNYVLVSATTRSSPFSLEEQTRVLAVVTEANDTLLQKYPDSKMIYSGVIRFAANGAQSMRSDVSIIGTGSLIGIILLVVGVFRSLRQFVLSLVPIVIGLLAAFAVSFWLFSRLHVITIAFGASLIGVCIDYVFHYFAEHKFGSGIWDADRGMQRIFPGITLGAVTSVIGYLGLALTPFPGLQQMAVFSSVGLLGAYGTVVCWLPGFLRTPGSRGYGRRSGAAVFSFGKVMLQFWTMLSEKRHWLPLAILFALAASIGIGRLRPNDDIRLLQNVPQYLIDNEKEIRKLVGGSDMGRFVLVEGADEEALLQRQEDVGEKLEQLREEGALGQFYSFAPFVPSLKRQVEDKALLKEKLIAENQPLTSYLERLGFKPEVSKMLISQVKKPVVPGLTVERWVADESSADLRHLWLGKTKRGYAALVLLENIGNEAAIKAMADKLDGVHYIDKVKNISSIFQRYRERAVWLVIWSYFVIYLLLLPRYGIKRGTAVMLAPVLATIGTLAVIGFTVKTINLFSIVSLMLVLGMGIDYSIFFAERRTENSTTMFAVILSAVTTILSFGLLSLSHTSILASVGLTVLSGISLAFFFSPIPIFWGKK